MSGNTAEPIRIDSLPQAVLHVDADAFFASVEQALKPELKGKPVVTGKERGIVACASYEAKALGIRRPMRIYEAMKICPGLYCLPSDYETYSLFSVRMFSILRRFTPVVEEYSIDEAFAELSGLRRIYRTGYPEIAWRIKQAIQRELGITVSAGLSLSKSLAKMASKEKKPDGFWVVRGRQIHTFLEAMPLERVCGFGPNSQALLRKQGIRTVLDYVRRDESWARRLLGKTGGELWRELRGEGVYGFQTEEKHEYASVSKTKTFSPPSGERDFVRAQLIRNLESAFIKLRRHRLRAGRLGVFLRTKQFESRGMEAELEPGTSSTFAAVPPACRLFEDLFREGFLYRSTGVILSRLEEDRNFQYPLFDDPVKIRALRAIDRVVDGAGEKYGKHALCVGTSLWLKPEFRPDKERLTGEAGLPRFDLGRRDIPERKKNLLRGENFRQRLDVPVWRIRV